MAKSKISAKSKAILSYTPTIKWSDESTITVSNIDFRYWEVSGILFISGRFNVTNWGSTGNKNIKISLPSEYSTKENSGVATWGFIIPAGGSTFNGLTNAAIRLGAKTLDLVAGIGGGYLGNVTYSTGYYGIFAAVPIA